MERSEPQLTTPQGGRDPWRWLMLAVLAVSVWLRALLVAHGGQMLWSDETRYNVARAAAEKIAAHDYGAAARLLLAGADHLFFKVVALLPAGLERWTDGRANPAWFFAGFSVLNIFLVWRIARAAGAGSREAALAALLLAAAATNFYYARHLFPYDLALTFALLALGAGWTGAGGAIRSLRCGVFAGLGFLTYNGAWLFGAMVLAGHVLRAWPDWRRAGARAAWAAAGLALPIVAAIGLARLAGVDLVASFLSFSRTVSQGDFGRGWKLLLDYFWSAEGPNLVLGLAAPVLVIAGAAAARAWNRGVGWVAGAAFILLGLLLLSDAWPKFVIYGRTARFLVPMVCLAGAFALERLWRTGGRAGMLAGVLALFATGQGVANLWAPLRQVFPAEFHAEANRLKESLRAQGDQRQMVILYADMVVGRASLLPALPDHDVLLARPNPMQYRPYLFEGFGEATRELLQSADIRMRLIAVNHARFDHPSDLRRPFPGVVRMTLQLPANPVPGTHEPLLVTGETGRGDFIYLVYQADSTLQIGFDHWGLPGIVSDPIAVDFEKPVVFTLSMGPLHGEAPEGNPAVDPRGWLYVAINGRVIWSQPAKFHAAPPDSISYLNNYIGGSTAGMKFSGTVRSIQSLLVPPFGD